MTRRHAVRLTLLVLAAVALAPGEASAKKKEEPAPEPVYEALEVGVFRLREPRAGEGSKLRLGFKLSVVALEENADRVRDLLESHKHRIRDAVFTAIRTCRQQEFQDPALELFRKRIQLRLKWVMPALKIERLLVSEYEFIHD